MTGFALRQEFSGRYGSAWMAVQHLRVLNALTAREVAQSVLGVSALTGRRNDGHARSLVDMRWFDDALEDGIPDTGSTSVDILSFLRSRALDAFVGPLASVLARDDVVRWCPECLRDGYHAVWFQLGALDRCPLHDLALEDACPYCHTPNEACALTPGVGGVFECSRCGRPRVLTNVQLWRREPTFLASEAQCFSGVARWFRQRRKAAVDWAALKRDLCLRRNEEDLTRRCAARTQAALAMFPSRSARILRALEPACEAVRVDSDSSVARRTAETMMAAVRKRVAAWVESHRECQVPASKIVIGDDRILMPCVPWDEVCCVRLAHTVWLARNDDVLKERLLPHGTLHPYHGIPWTGVMRLMMGDFLETLAILSEYRSRKKVSAERLRAALRVSVTADLGGAVVPPADLGGAWWVVTTRLHKMPSHPGCPRQEQRKRGTSAKIRPPQAATVERGS